MGNYTEDSFAPGKVSNVACFSHWFYPGAAKPDWVTLYLTDASGTGQFYIDDFIRPLFDERVWKYILVTDEPEQDSYGTTFKWSFRFDCNKIDANSLFFMLTALRYPQEFSTLTRKYHENRQKHENKFLCFYLPHVQRAMVENFNHTLTHFCLFEGQTDKALMEYDFKKQWPILDEGNPYTKSTKKKKIFNTLLLSQNDPYMFGRKVPIGLEQQLSRLFGEICFEDR
jgi:hypothetical protein